MDRNRAILFTTRQAEGLTPDRGPYEGEGIISGRACLLYLRPIASAPPKTHANTI